MSVMKSDADDLMVYKNTQKWNPHSHPKYADERTDSLHFKGLVKRNNANFEARLALVHYGVPFVQ